jgi:hypothetical protein
MSVRSGYSAASGPFDPTPKQIRIEPAHLRLWTALGRHGDVLI